jgi:hypothetical protein
MSTQCCPAAACMHEAMYCSSAPHLHFSTCSITQISCPVIEAHAVAALRTAAIKLSATMLSG